MPGINTQLAETAYATERERLQADFDWLTDCDSLLKGT